MVHMVQGREAQPGGILMLAFGSWRSAWREVLRGMKCHLRFEHMRPQILREMLQKRMYVKLNKYAQTLDRLVGT
jgi:hypothetical protein